MFSAKKLAVLGSTGSIGRQTLEVVSEQRDKYQVTVLTAGCNIDLLSRQIVEYRPLAVCIKNQADLPHLKELLHELINDNYMPELYYGIEGMQQLVKSEDVDLVLLAVSGSAGLLPALAALRAGKQLALANKETLVSAGRLVMSTAEQMGIEILPVDSEHSAIFQCLQAQCKPKIKKIWLTASGGPFINYTENELSKVTAAQALRHPTWSMGRKITIDSASLMNKGMEVIEAKWLFNVSLDQIKILIHPESIIHSMVEFEDNAVLAQMGNPDIRIPIQYALSYPERLLNSIQPVDFYELGQLNFSRPDLKRFPCLKLAIDAAEAGGTYPAAMNAANEIAVREFLSGNIGFTDLAILVRRVLDKHQSLDEMQLENILQADTWARITTEEMLGQI